RKQAEHAVADMADNELKTAAFEVILRELMHESDGGSADPGLVAKGSSPAGPSKPKGSLARRIMTLAGEGFFFEQRSLSEVQEKLAEHGWHYAQPNLSTPLM